MRVLTYGAQYVLMVIVALMGYMFVSGIENRDTVLAEESAYYAILFVLAQLVPIGIRAWNNWGVSWATFFLFSSQLVYGSYLRVVYHHMVPEATVWTVLSLVLLTVSVVLVALSLFKMVARSGETMLDIMLEEQETELHRIR